MDRPRQFPNGNPVLDESEITKARESIGRNWATQGVSRGTCRETREDTFLFVPGLWVGTILSAYATVGNLILPTLPAPGPPISVVLRPTFLGSRILHVT